jgi:aconitate hydratase
MLVGADSHTTMAGALAVLAVGAGSTEVAVAMAGRPYALERPVVVGVDLRGSLSPWVQSKDVVLELLRRRGVREGRGRIFEFHGDGVAALSATDRGTICNMVMETGATTGIFPSDEQTRRWLAAQGREEDFTELAADAGAAYDELEVIELGSLEPLIALPSSPGNVVPVTEVAGTPTRQVCVGSSVNSSYEDLAVVAAVLRGRTLQPELDLTVTPGSRHILDLIVRSGVYADLLAAGARILEPACGPCIGMGQAPAAGAVSVRTFNRNFPGRSGTNDDRVYLCSPATAAATALRGVITDPRELGEPSELETQPTSSDVRLGQIVSPPEPAEAGRVELEKGRNIVGPPPVEPLPDSIEARVLIVAPDDVSTGDLAPDGALGVALWSNVPACARYMFRRIDPDFPARAQEWGGGIVVAGHNYGQGSSREQAAFAALYLGVRAVVAKSFARIHRTNLIAQGVLPFSFADEVDYERAERGQQWSIPVDIAETACRAETPFGPVQLELRLTPREREILEAGGLIAYAATPASGSR